MAQKAIREYDGKKILSEFLPHYSGDTIKINQRFVQISPDTDLDGLIKEHPWLTSEKLVVKPDQLIKRRGKNNLLLLNATWEEVLKWLSHRSGSELTIDGITGKLDTFIVEPFFPHEAEDEIYIAIRSVREGDEILFYPQGGINVGDVDAKAYRLRVGVLVSVEEFSPDSLLKGLPEEKKRVMSGFIKALLRLYREAGFCYLEINPAVLTPNEVIPLDIAAKLDDTAEFECSSFWHGLKFPPAFGRTMTDEEKYIRSLDEKTGASLKLTVLNPKGRIWTMVAGGGASVIYADTVADLGFGNELAVYGEYSGNPNDEETYQYAKTVLDLMTREPAPKEQGKVLLIGGGIANFTDVAKTFKGIIRALREYKDKLKKVNAKIFVRRGGPNYKIGLKNMMDLEGELGVPIEVYGPETHMTRIVKIALSR